MLGSVHDQGTPQVVQVIEGKSLIIKLEWPGADANTISMATEKLCEYVRHLWFAEQVINEDGMIVVHTRLKRSRQHWYWLETGLSTTPGKRSLQTLRRTLNNQMPNALSWAKKTARNKATAKTLHPAYKKELGKVALRAW